jgi:hypothetical protein
MKYGCKNGEEELLTEQNGHLSWRKSSKDFKGCTVEESAVQ